MCIHIQSVTYMHPDKDVLFSNVSFSMGKGEKVALIGNNGSGKSTLMQLITKELSPSEGEVICLEPPYYIPQHFGQFNHLTIAGALRIEGKIQALHAILQGDVSVEHFTVLDDDWDIEEKAVAALHEWGLPGVPLSHPMHLLSGGEKTKVFLAGIALHSPSFILMDEPTNHLDDVSRGKLYRFITSTSSGMLVVSHDRILLNLLSSTYELTSKGVIYYAGNYDFYKEQKELAVQALQARLEENGKQLQKARRQAREVMERQQKHDVRGKKQNIKSGVGKMAMNTFKDQAEKSSVRLNNVHTDKIHSLAKSVTDIRSELPDMKTMRLDFNSSSLHIGKVLVTAKNLNYAYQSEELWKSPLSFVIQSGDRIHLKGANGSGKTTLLKTLLGKLKPIYGNFELSSTAKLAYFQQDLVWPNKNMTPLQYLQEEFPRLRPRELRQALARMGLTAQQAMSPLKELSGGEQEKVKLAKMQFEPANLLFLDEPTNHLDIATKDSLRKAIVEFKGGVIIVSHERDFFRGDWVDKTIDIEKMNNE